MRVEKRSEKKGGGRTCLGKRTLKVEENLCHCEQEATILWGLVAVKQRPVTSADSRNDLNFAVISVKKGQTCCLSVVSMSLVVETL